MELLLGFEVTQWITVGNKSSELRSRGVRLRKAGASFTQTLECDGAFVMIRSTPNTDYLRGFVDLDRTGLVTATTPLPGNSRM